MKRSPDPRAWGLLLLILAAAPAEAVQDRSAEVRQWLQRMIQAMSQRSYEGTFVYLHGKRLETLRIEHRASGPGSRQRIWSLNGPLREIRRGRRGITCITPRAGAVSVEKWVTPGANGLLQLDFPRLEKNYVFHPLGEDRIAGRGAVGLGIIPRDRLRYGYRLYLDRASALPLEIDLMDERAQPVERILFTHLALTDGAPDLVAADAPETQVEHRVEHKAAPMPEGDRRWTFIDLPPGFEVQMHDEWTDEDGGVLEHFLVSDGLASVSVYVEPLAGDGEGLEGGAHLGAVHAWGRRVDGIRVTAVGETPALTVRLIAEALKPLAEHR